MRADHTAAADPIGAARNNLQAPVYERLRAMILDGRLMPGDRIDEEAFSRAFRVSRTPLREALHRLDHEGIASIAPRRGAFVADFAKSEILDLLELREGLEGLAARLACVRASDAALDRLAGFVASGDLTDAPRLIEADRRFHELVYASTGNRKLIETSRRINDQVQLVRLTTTLLDDRRTRSIEEIRRIVAAIRRRDADRAEQLARAHVHAAIGAVRSNFPEGATLSMVAHRVIHPEGEATR